MLRSLARISCRAAGPLHAAGHPRVCLRSAPLFARALSSQTSSALADAATAPAGAPAAAPEKSSEKPARSKKPKKSSSDASSEAGPGAGAGGSIWAPIRGTHDFLPAESSRQRAMESLLAALASQYSYGELRTPMLEKADLCARSLGADSDVVSKEMFRFDDHGTDTVLRPEATASVARALLHAGLISNTPAVQRYWYSGPMFRRERPQAGRYRQFLQFGVELIGADAVAADAEVIHMAQQALVRMGLAPYVRLELNSLGDTASRAAYVKALTAFLHVHSAQLSPDSRQRLDRGSVLRILDSKEAQDQALLRGTPLPGDASAAPRPAAPLLSDHLSPEAASRFTQLQQSLRDAGVSFQLNPFLVRGLDYYSHACFEFVIDSAAVTQRLKQLGKKAAVPAQSTVLAGGRYDGLFATLGGPAVPAIGWAAGVDRLLLLSDLVEPEARVSLPLPVPIGVVMNTEASPVSSSTAVGSSSLAAAAAAPGSVSLAEAYAALCTFVRSGCHIQSSTSSAVASRASSHSLHRPAYSVVQSFHPNMWKQLKHVTRVPTASDSSAQRVAGQPPMLAVLIVGQHELGRDEVLLRDQRTREQSSVKLGALARRLNEAREAMDGAHARSDATSADDPILTFAMLRDAMKS